MKHDDDNRLEAVKCIIAKNLAKQRLIKEWTQLQAANGCDIAESIYHDYESKQPRYLPSFKRLCEFSQLYNITITELLDGIDEHYSGRSGRYPGKQLATYKNHKRPNHPRIESQDGVARRSDW